MAQQHLVAFLFLFRLDPTYLFRAISTRTLANSIFVTPPDTLRRQSVTGFLAKNKRGKKSQVKIPETGAGAEKLWRNIYSNNLL